MTNVSIITPVYNVERFISKNINSIINQSDKNFELLLIDDGSKDNSINIAKELLKNSDVDYKIIVQENAGVSAARNHGIKIAKGKYVCFLDSDDYIHKDYVKMMYNKASSNDYDLVFCDYIHVDENENIIINSTTRFLDESISGRDAALKQLSTDITIGMGSALYRTSILRENNIYFDTNRKYAEDVVFTVKALLHMNQIMSVDKGLMYYLRSSASITNKVSLTHLDCYYSYVELLEYIRKIGNYTEIEKFLLEFKIPYSIAHIFSIFSRSSEFKEYLNEFLSKEDVKNSLKNYKLQKITKSDIRYFIQCKGILYCPGLLLKIFNKVR